MYSSPVTYCLFLATKRCCAGCHTWHVASENLWLPGEQREKTRRALQDLQDVDLFLKAISQPREAANVLPPEQG